MENQPKLDKLDWKILYELDCDATQSFAHIGKKLNAGRDVIAYRVKRLEELGVIEGYITIMDFGKLGYLCASLYLKFHHDTPEIRKEIAQYYAGRKEIWWCFDMTPDYDFAFGWFGSDVVDIRRNQFLLLEKYRKYIRTFKLRIFAHFYHFGRNYLGEKSRQGRPAKPISIWAIQNKITDDVDDRLLQALSENARVSYVDAARQVGVSAAQAHYRIAQLRKKGVLLRSRPKLDLAKIGYEYYKLDIYLDDYSAREKIEQYLFCLPNVIYAFDVLGGADLEVDIHTRSFDEFMEIQDGIKKKFSSAISHTEYYQFKKEYKQVYFPRVAKTGRSETGNCKCR
jgi:DNA-binding Lrp family transcriptional regulator